MGEEIILCRYGEISLKGKNRFLFEGKLVRNIKSYLDNKKIKFSLKKIRGRIFISTGEIKETVSYLRNVFGLASVSPAVKTNLNMEDIKKESLNIAKNRKFSTFRVTANRVRKLLLPSPQIEREVGSVIEKNLVKKVSLKNFDLEINIEVSDAAYVFTEKIPCFGGLPLGVEGNVLALIEDKASVLAAWFMMKRGCYIIPVAFEKIDTNLLRKYGCSSDLIIIKKLDDINKIVEENRCRAVVVNQTVGNFKEIETETPVLRPLVAFTGKEIDENLEKIK